MPRLLDLFCGAGGAAMGYHQAGFEVVGVDTAPQPRFPFEFHQAEALEFPLHGFDAIHASPPCQAYSNLRVLTGKEYPDLVGAVRDRLLAWGGPYVIENVPGAPLRSPLTFCGSEFGLTTTTALHGRVWLRRHRLFESSVFFMGAGGCNCYGKLTVPVYGHGAGGNRVNLRGKGVARASREVMGIDWMTRAELDQAIPPAYTRHIGEALMARLGEKEAA